LLSWHRSTSSAKLPSPTYTLLPLLPTPSPATRDTAASLGAHRSVRDVLRASKRVLDLLPGRCAMLPAVSPLLDFRHAATHCQLATGLTGRLPGQGRSDGSAAASACNSRSPSSCPLANLHRGRLHHSLALPRLAGTRRVLSCQPRSAYSSASVAALAAVEERTDAEAEQRPFGSDSKHGGPVSAATLLQVQRVTEQLKQFMETYGSAQLQPLDVPGSDASTVQLPGFAAHACCFWKLHAPLLWAPAAAQS